MPRHGRTKTFSVESQPLELLRLDDDQVGRWAEHLAPSIDHEGRLAGARLRLRSRVLAIAAAARSDKEVN